MASPFSCKLPVTMHRSPYPTIDPSRPELSQHGRAALVTGSSSGIGFAIARNLAHAKAAVVILTGRQAESLADAVKRLELQYPATRFIGKKMDIANSAHVDKLWDELHAGGVVVDVLVLNAARVQRTGPTMLELGHEEVFEDFVTNVKGSMHFAERFYKQPLRQKARKLNLVHVSTMAIHEPDVSVARPNYPASKSAATMVLQQIARDVSPTDMQILSFHPGAIFTGAAEKAGYTRESLNWDDEDLPGSYAVWAASDEAAFLHGRFTWAAWDVDELQSGELRKRIDSDPAFLKVGVAGL